jgi:hypothetical protein
MKQSRLLALIKVQFITRFKPSEKGVDLISRSISRSELVSSSPRYPKPAWPIFQSTACQRSCTGE